MKIIETANYEKIAQKSNGFNTIVRVHLKNENYGLQGNVWTENFDEEEAKQKFIEDLMEQKTITQNSDIAEIKVLAVEPYYLYPEERVNLGWSLLDFEDVNEVGPNQPDQHLDTTTPYIMQIGRILISTSGSARWSVVEYV